MTHGVDVHDHGDAPGVERRPQRHEARIVERAVVQFGRAEVELDPAGAAAAQFGERGRAVVGTERRECDESLRVGRRRREDGLVAGHEARRSSLAFGTPEQDRPIDAVAVHRRQQGGHTPLRRQVDVDVDVGQRRGAGRERGRDCAGRSDQHRGQAQHSHESSHTESRRQIRTS